jgi:hypothetical protein
MVASLRGSKGMGTEEDELRTGCIWAAGFHHVTAHSRLARVLKLTNHLFFLIFQIFFRATVNRGYGGGLLIFVFCLLCCSCV